MVGWLLYFFEFNSVTMPPTHKPGWSGKEFTDCPCTACERIRERARATALLHEGRKGNTTMGPILRIHMELGRACPKSTTPKDLGLAGMEMEDDTDVVRIELLSGEVVRVKGTETVAALKKLPKGSSAEEAAKVLLSERAS